MTIDGQGVGTTLYSFGCFFFLLRLLCSFSFFFHDTHTCLRHVHKLTWTGAVLFTPLQRAPYGPSVGAIQGHTDLELEMVDVISFFSYAARNYTLRFFYARLRSRPPIRNSTFTSTQSVRANDALWYIGFISSKNLM